RVEGKLKIVLCRFARIDGTAGELANGFVHATEHPWRMRSGSLAGGRIEARQPPTAAGKGGVAASRHDIQAGLRARATAAPLRRGVCFLSSETLRRSASIRLITPPRGGKCRLALLDGASLFCLQVREQRLLVTVAEGFRVEVGK